ncbi:transglutaminase family protein [Nocardioides stalactiti]|uniref:transglutaminase family protein n=1 Tax=Nocardioides stalactiti TaxID=2755356 RepID=UPI001602838A|nr:transglutaminase family protein [Nocardioides stalactiti]
MQTDDDFGPRRYQVRHRTTYTYSDDVTGCYERGFLAPRATPAQRVVSNDVRIVPEPDLVATHVDHFGNRSYYVEVRTDHRVLEVEKTSIIEVDRPRPDLDALDRWTVADAAEWARVAADPVLRVDHLLPTTLVSHDDEVRSYAAAILPPDRPLGQALRGLVGTLHRDFTYRSGATTVRTTLPELLSQRAGVCQDFAHLALGCLRSVGLPARYVSGYLETTPPPGAERLEGADASHAWASVLVPGPAAGTWVDLDPTNDQVADSRYLVTAWGRDFRDVSPLKGVVFTEAATSTLEVGVDVVRLDA